MDRVTMVGVLVCWLFCANLVFGAQKQQFIIPLPININVSDELTLSRALVGVGPVKAAAIVDYRDRHGPFTRPQDLMQVKGIGKGTLRKNRSRISVE